MNKKTLGSMLMVAGTSIGAGMLVMPINSAGIGFSVTLAQLAAFFILMLIPALSVTELVQFAPTGTSISGLVRLQFGRPGLIISNILVYIFIYALVCAYVSGLTSMLMSLLGVAEEHKNLFTVLAIIPFGALVVFTSRVADLVNQAFFYIMIIALAILIVVAMPHVSGANLSSLPQSQTAIFKSLPIFFLAYGFHIIIPSISDYLDRDTKQIRIALIGGLAIPFVIFATWNLVVHGIATQEELLAFAQTNDPNIASLITEKGGSASNSAFLSPVITIFSFTALVTSFIGVSLALVTNLKELFSTNAATKAINLADEKQKAEENAEENEDDDIFTFEEHHHLKSRLQNPLLIFTLCYTLPLVLVLFVPQAFVFFLNLAAIIFTIQGLIMPMLAQVVTRIKQPELYTEGTYRLKVPNFILIALCVAFLAIAIFDVVK